MSGGIKFLLTTILIFIQTAVAKKNKQSCVPSSCGHIHNISYPFRLKSDPKHCSAYYELDCEGNHTIFTMPEIGLKYYVEAINYSNSTIRLVDPGMREQAVCSLPQASIAISEVPIFLRDDFCNAGLAVHSPILSPITIFSCPFSINSTVPVEINNCVNNTTYASDASSDLFRGHTYATIGELSLSFFRVGCTVDLQSFTSLHLPDANANISTLDLHHALAYGFELSWYCDVFYKNKEVTCKVYNFGFFKFCVVGDDDGNGLNHAKRHLLRVLTGIVPWMLPLVGLLVVQRIVLFPCVLVFLIIELRRRHFSVFDGIESFLDGENNFVTIRYRYSHVRKMTMNFEEKLGQGGYGSVYKGKLQSGRSVAVKMLSKPKADGQDFINEVATIGRIHHVNVVRLTGYCAEGSKRALVYDFMPNGSLEKYITPQEGGILLSWQRKSEISLGVARGIEYLHRGCVIQILHFDIKPHNILLDENFIPKLSDFGLAKSYPTDKSIVTLTAARGTIGYVAPELINRSIGPISYKADVYSFGMLLIEIAGLKRNLAARNDMSTQYFPHWIYDQFDKEKEIVVDEEMHDDDEKKIVKKLTLVALWCIQMNPLDRPSMTKVVEMLEGELQALQTPPRPSESQQLPLLEFNLSSSVVGSTESVKLLESCFDSGEINIVIG